MASMQAIAALSGSNKPGFVKCEPPLEVAAGQVMCRTLELGICGTDREILLSAKPWTPPSADHLILGHECLAQIEVIGDGVTEYQTGDLVIPVVRRALPGYSRRPDLLPFGTFVERGIVCEHGFSQPLWIDRPEHLLPVPDGLADLAVLVEPLACSEKGVNEALLLSRARLGNSAWSAAAPPRVAVTGMGPIGFAAVLAAIARGWSVTMFGRDEPSTFRARLLKRLGGQYRELRCLESIAENVEHDGYDLLLECTGSDEVLLAASLAVRSCGVIVWLGSNRAPQPALRNVDRLIRESLLRNHLHVGCVNAARRDFLDATAHLSQLARDRRQEVADLITARMQPAEALWHYEHRQPQGIKAVVQYA